jgi:hexosaminidase
MENKREKAFITPRDIIPLPVRIEHSPGQFQFTRETRILNDTHNLWNAGYLRELVTRPTGFPLEIQLQSDRLIIKNSIHLYLNPSLVELGREGYRLQVLPDSILIESSETAGVFYGIQTLRQLLPAEIEERVPVLDMVCFIPCLLIEDKPRFTWRGFMLDEGRYFHGKQTVYFTLDLMALQKMNVFHWHLTEDQGWRIEIIKYPKLTEIGSYRAGTSKTMLGKKDDGVPHCGFYTQVEIKEIIAYAAKRNITIVPEIEMPGHSLAAIASYPELACGAGPFNVATHFGVFPDIYCAGKDQVYCFLQDVLEEILALFPSPYIHIGGDEAPKKRWKSCPNCQRRIHEQGLKGEHALQIYFTNHIAAYLESKGRRVMGWNDILHDGLVDGAVIQYWAGGRHRLLEAIRNEKRAVVMSPYLSAYLDHSYYLMPLSLAYQYEPIPHELDDDEAGSILGLEFPLWSEWVPSRSRLDYQVYPRLTAMAETGWTSKNKKDLKDFQQRLEKFLVRLDRLGVRYAQLKDAQPPIFTHWLGIFTIPFPQTRTA